MKKQLFFDDFYLFGRDNVQRVYGRIERIAEYSDGVCSTDFCTANVFLLDDGRYRMLYFGHGIGFEGRKLFSAISDDGVHFVPEDLPPSGEREFSHEIMTLPSGGEVACIFEDKRGTERYKLLMAEFDHQLLYVNDTLYVSDDLLSWRKKEGVCWGDGTEPLASAYYNEHKGRYDILQRPFWGIRTVGCKSTTDWQTFTPYRYVLGVDSKDEALCEIYGMHAFAYGGMYVGAAHLYRGLVSEYGAKYKNGRIDCELAYSYDGDYWRRSLGEPFLSGGEECPMVWLSSMVHRDGEILLYGSASELVHGPAFHNPGRGRLFVYRLREDDFISLRSIDETTPARVITREKIWHGGELHLNIKASNVTVGVYETNESEMVAGNALGIAKPLTGYSHEDCIPFSGDSLSHVPQYKNQNTLSSLAGRTLVFEVRYTNGALYSLSGDYTDVFNTEGVRYRKFGEMLQKK